MKLAVIAQTGETRTYIMAALAVLTDCELAQYDAEPQSLASLFAWQPDAVLCTAAKEAEALLASMSGSTAQILLAVLALPNEEETAQLNRLFEQGVRPVLPQLFAPHVTALRQALSSPLVAEVATVNCTRKQPESGSAVALAFQDILIACRLLGQVKEVFAQRNSGAGRDSLLLTLRMEQGGIVGLSAQTGAGSERQICYDYACRDGVVSYDSLRQPLFIHTDESKSFPGYDEDLEKAFRLAVQAALSGETEQCAALLACLSVLPLIEDSLRTGKMSTEGGAL